MASDTKELALAYVDDAQSQVLVASTISVRLQTPTEGAAPGLIGEKKRRSYVAAHMLAGDGTISSLSQ